MFRGITRTEQRVALVLAVVAFGALALGSWARSLRWHVNVAGPARVHGPGVLAEPLPTVAATVSATMTPAAPAKAEKAAGRIDVNTADATLLDTLPGIGKTRAEAIVQYRQEHGGFRKSEDLLEIPGIGEKTLANLMPFITLGETAALAATPTPTAPEATPTPRPTPPPPAKVNINTATAEELDSLDGIGPALAKKIIQHRALHGPFRNIEQLKDVSGIGPALVERNRHRLAVQ